MRETHDAQISIFECYAEHELGQQLRELSIDSLCIDSTVVLSNIHAPSDSQLLNDGIRVLSRMMVMSTYQHQRKYSVCLCSSFSSGVDDHRFS